MKRLGDEPLRIVAACVPNKVREALLTEAKAEGASISSIIRDVLGEWYAEWAATQSWRREEGEHERQG